MQQVRNAYLVSLRQSSVDSYTLADLERVTSAKRRSLQLWADAKVIMADRSTDRAGTGTHRRFSRKEAIVACIVHAFALHQVAIGELLYISLLVRFWIELGEQHGSEAWALLILEEAMTGQGEALMVFESWRSSRTSRRPTSDTQLSYHMRLAGRHSDTRIQGADANRGTEHMINVFPTGDVEFQNLNEPEGFASVICLKTYLSNIDS